MDTISTVDKASEALSAAKAPALQRPGTWVVGPRVLRQTSSEAGAS